MSNNSMKVDEMLVFEAAKGTRLHRYFMWVDVLDSSLWWNNTLRVWEPLNTHPDHKYSSGAPCRTLKAFKRMLRKHPNIQGKCVLVNRYIGFDVYDNKEG